MRLSKIYALNYNTSFLKSPLFFYPIMVYLIQVIFMARLMIAGTSSGCGKTSVVCGILKALKNRDMDIISYKCGPDYIDGMLHEKAIGVHSSNLDGFFCERDELCTLLDRKGLCLIEGVMGYYDGIALSDKASSYDIARMTDTPVVLVVQCKGMSNSIGAVIRGFKEYRDSNIKGVILNRISPMLYDSVVSLCKDMGIKVYGFLPEIKEAVLESRHLGLVTDDSLDKYREKIDILREYTEKYIDIQGLIGLSESAPPLRYNRITIDKACSSTIAVAKDEAFCFNYNDNISLLEAMGCNIVYFSPLRDSRIPECDRLILSGGYPELYKEALSENKAMIRDIKEKISGGLKTIAECGGFMYLHEHIDGVPMAGVIKGSAVRQERLSHFGYITLRAEKNGLLCEKGEEIKAHEFHYYKSTNEGSDFTAFKPMGTGSRRTAHTYENLYCGFPHIYFWGNREAAKRFAR